MPVIERVVKPSTHRGKKAILAREPKIVEDAKQILFIKGTKTNPVLLSCLQDLQKLKKPDGQMLQKRNEVHPFEDPTPIENFGRKKNASLFVMVNNSKKRPNNVTLGRLFEHTIMDIVEFGLENYVSLNKIREMKKEKLAKRLMEEKKKGTSREEIEKFEKEEKKKMEDVSNALKPMLVFQGEQFENNHEFGRIKNLLVDMFQRETVGQIRLQGLEHVLSFTAHENCVLVRSYKVALKKSGTRIPKIELVEMGPNMDLRIRRTKLATDDLFKQACKKPKELKVKKKKNIQEDGLANILGRIHVGKQKLHTIQTRKMKGLKKTMAERKQEKRKNLETEEDHSKKQKVSDENVD